MRWLGGDETCPHGKLLRRARLVRAARVGRARLRSRPRASNRPGVSVSGGRLLRLADGDESSLLLGFNYEHLAQNPERSKRAWIVYLFS